MRHQTSDVSLYSVNNVFILQQTKLVTRDLSLYSVNSILFLTCQVNSILRNVATKLDYDEDQLEDLYERTAWLLEEKTGVPASSYEMFKKAVVWVHLTLVIPETHLVFVVIVTQKCWEGAHSLTMRRRKR